MVLAVPSQPAVVIATSVDGQVADDRLEQEVFNIVSTSSFMVRCHNHTILTDSEVFISKRVTSILRSSFNLELTSLGTVWSNPFYH